MNPIPKPTNLPYLFLLGVLYACLSCGSPTTSPAPGQDSTSMPLQNSTPEILHSDLSDHSDLETKMDSAPFPCTFSPAKFRKKMGLGVVLLGFVSYPFDLYQEPDSSGPPIKLAKSPTYYGRVVIEGKDKDFFKWYVPPTEYTRGGHHLA